MEDFKHNSKYDFMYDVCIYSGISGQIEHEIKYGKEDKRKELKYLVDRYNKEVVISGAHLQERYNDYVKALKDKGIISG